MARAWVLAALVIAAAGARPFAGGWNDGSRLAAVECLAEYGTLAIDDSVFVHVPAGAFPYPADRPDLLTFGTRDKLLVGGRFYSDKSYVPAVLGAAVYKAWLAVGGPTARERTDLFCWLMTFTTAGLPFVAAVWCVRRLGVTVGVAGRTRELFTLAFALATVAAAYTRHVNAHIQLLAVAAGLCLVLERMGSAQSRRGWACIAGSLAGLGYTLDLGLGPGLLLATFGTVLFVTRSSFTLALALLAALPWLVAHHALNYAVGGTLGPANAVPEYVLWPGSPFTPASMTGGLKHSPGGLLLYAADLLVGKKGFFFHNLPLLLAPGAAFLLLRNGERRGLAPPVFAAMFCGLGWLAYSATSTNWSGECCSVRWFVPFVAPGFWLLAHLLHDHPRFRPDFVWLTAVGAVMGPVMWWYGPWARHMVPGYWGFVAVALVGWGVVRWRGSNMRPPHALGFASRLTIMKQSSSAA